MIGHDRAVRHTRRGGRRGGAIGRAVLLAGAILGGPLLAGGPADEWRSWRGPTGNNHAAATATAPLSTAAATVRWQVPIPGRGHGSPIVVGDLVVVPTADTRAGEQRVLAFNKADGTPRFDTLIHKGRLPTENHPNNTEASCTCASNGRLIFCAFYNADAIMLTALTLDGKEAWQANLGPYTLDVYRYGYAASPVLYKDSVIVVADMDGASFLCARDQATGRELWRTPRHGRLTFSSPIVARTGGRDQLVLSGGGSVVSYDPDTGKKLWTSAALPTATCGTMVWNDKCVFGSGGYPQSQTAAIATDGSGRVVWSNAVKCYEQSLLVVGDYVYAVADTGVAHCWRAADGREMWKARLGGKSSASPLLVGDTIHILDEGGNWIAFKADPARLTVVARSRLGDEAFATPAVVGDTMYVRYADSGDGPRQEHLAALTSK